MKIAFITTVFNDSAGCKSLFSSLLSQTKLPTEIIVVDSSSDDKTLKTLEFFKEKFERRKIPFNIYHKKSNRSQGRNLAIRKVRSQIITISDAGCILDKEWLNKIASPFSEKVDVVAGYYIPKTDNIFEKCLSTYTCVMSDKVDSNFLPSSRSVAFKKESWISVGGYPENLNTGEDLFFARKLKNAGLKFKVEKNAIVFWPQRKNIFQAARQFFHYAYGDGRARYIRKNTVLLFARYIIGLCILIYAVLSKISIIPFLLSSLLFFYILWSIYKNYKYIRKPESFFWLPILQFTADICVIAGMVLGFLSNIWDTKKTQ